MAGEEGLSEGQARAILHNAGFGEWLRVRLVMIAASGANAAAIRAIELLAELPVERGEDDLAQVSMEELVELERRVSQQMARVLEAIRSG